MYQYHFISMNKPAMKVQVMTTAQRIRSFRQKYHFSQKSFAEFCNVYAVRYGVKVTPADIAGYEACRCCPKIDKLQSIADAMGVSIDYFCGYGASNRKSNKALVEIRKTAKPNKVS